MCYIRSVSKTDNSCTFTILSKKKKKKTIHGNMGKSIKSYVTIPTLQSPGKGGKPYGKKSQSLGLIKHNSGRTHFFDSPSSETTCKNSKFLFFLDLNLQQIMQISRNSLQNSSTLVSILSDC